MVNGKIKAPRLWTVLPDNSSRAAVLAKSAEISVISTTPGVISEVTINVSQEG